MLSHLEIFIKAFSLRNVSVSKIAFFHVPPYVRLIAVRINRLLLAIWVLCGVPPPPEKKYNYSYKCESQN